MTDRLYWQGSHDNFCGLYAAADIIARHKTASVGRSEGHEEFFHKAFLSLLRKVEARGWLTANRIGSRVESGGFTSPQLTRIFNALSENAREKLVATPFSSAKFKRFADHRDAKLRIQPITGGLPNCAIVKHDRGRHWLAVVGVRDDGTYSCFDPSTDNVRRRERIQWDDGVFIAKPGALTL